MEKKEIEVLICKKCGFEDDECVIESDTGELLCPDCLEEFEYEKSKFTEAKSWSNI